MAEVEQALKSEIDAAKPLTSPSDNETAGGDTVTNPSFNADEAEAKEIAVSSGDVIYVGVRLRIDQLSEISTVEQSYTVKGLLELDWYANAEEVARCKADCMNYQPDAPCFWPAFQNIVEYETIKEDVEVVGNPARNVHSIWFKGKFTEQFEVQNFPFDVQDFTFVFFVENYMSKVILVPYRGRPDCFILNTTYLSIQDWDIVHVDAHFRAVDWGMAKTGSPSKPWKEDPGKYASTAYFRIQAKRKSYAFAMRVLFWMFLLSLISFGQVGLHPLNIEARLNFSIGLIFAVVAFQIIIGDALPMVPYLTIVDKYNLGVFMLIILITIEALLVGWREEGLVEWYLMLDQWFYVCMLVIYVLFHIVGVVYVKMKIKEENGKIGTNIEDTQDLQPVFMTVFAEEANKRTNYGLKL